MLSLLFNRFPKRRPIGLLALGEWGPPTGAPVAVTGSITTEQPGQIDALNGSVLEPVIQVVGGGGGGTAFPHVPPVTAISGTCETEQPEQHLTLQGNLELVGTAETSQSRQGDKAAGIVRQVVLGAVGTEQQAQQARIAGSLEFVGVGKTFQPPQETLASGTPAIVGVCGTEQAAQRSVIFANLEIVTSAVTSQAIQNDALSGDMIDTELEMLTALLIQAA